MILGTTLLLSIGVVGIRLMKGENKPLGSPFVECADTSGIAIELFPLEDEVEEVYDFDYDVYYNVSSRWWRQLSREELKNARSLEDVFRESDFRDARPFRNSRVIVLGDELAHLEQESSDSQFFNGAQKQILQEADYNSSLLVTGVLEPQESGPSVRDSFLYYISVVPEQRAEYLDGFEALVRHVKSHSIKEFEEIGVKNLQPGQVSFSVDEKGRVGNAKIKATCGHKKMDAKMIRLIEEIPGIWVPAKNADGENVSEELVFSFGRMGC